MNRMKPQMSERADEPSSRSMGQRVKHDTFDTLEARVAEEEIYGQRKDRVIILKN